MSVLVVLTAMTVLAATVSAGSSAGYPFASSPKILVGLAEASPVTFTSPAPFTLGATVAFSSPDTPVVVPAGSQVVLTMTGSGISWGFTPPGGYAQAGQSEGPVLLSPAEGVGWPAFSVMGASYRGALVAIPSSGTMVLANLVDMEDYVKSTVGAEVPGRWPEECMKAQAVTVRSYAAYKLRMSKTIAPVDLAAVYYSLNEGCVLLWATDQVYEGIGAESDLSIAAAEETRGLILTYDSSPAAAYYCSDAGGTTEEARYVWGGSLPYLQSVEEVPHESPYSQWSVRLTASEVLSGFSSAGARLTAAPDLITGYGPGLSGRWTGVTAPSASGAAQVTGTAFRAGFPQVRSMLFSSYRFGGGFSTTGLLSAGLPVYVQGDGEPAQVRLNASTMIGADGVQHPGSAGAYATTGAISDGQATYVLQGSGWGHGVGLSQWGAKAMAESGSLAESILTFYYPGTCLEAWWP